MTTDAGFAVPETTIADIHAAYRAGTLTARALVEAYLDRIETYPDFRNSGVLRMPTH